MKGAPSTQVLQELEVIFWIQCAGTMKSTQKPVSISCNPGHSETQLTKGKCTMLFIRYDLMINLIYYSFFLNFDDNQLVMINDLKLKTLKLCLHLGSQTHRMYTISLSDYVGA